MIRQYLVTVDYDPTGFEADGSDGSVLIASYIEYLLRTERGLHANVYLVPEEPTVPAQ